MENNQSTVTQPIIDLQNVAVGYDNREDVLKNIYFSLLPGSFTFVTGKSGAGKTTLLNMLYLVKKPRKGVLKVFGNNIKFFKPRYFGWIKTKNRRWFSGFPLIGTFERV